MKTISRPINERDLISYLQKNQALLETIIHKLQSKSLENEIKEDTKFFHESLEKIKADFDLLTKK